jgi:hypothetical protein
MKLAKRESKREIYEFHRYLEYIVEDSNDEISLTALDKEHFNEAVSDKSI